MSRSCGEGSFWSRKITDQCSSEAAILTHQAGYSLDLPNFVSERLCLRRRVEVCTLDSLSSHEMQEVISLLLAARMRSVKKDGDGWPPVSSRSTELL